MSEKEIAEFEASLPQFLRDLPGEWWGPEWRCMDGGTPRVYALDYDASIKAGRPLLNDAY